MTSRDAGATVVDLAAERRERRPDAVAPLTDTQRALLLRLRTSRRRLLTRAT